jgi:hypothetical protein
MILNNSLSAFLYFKGTSGVASRGVGRGCQLAHPHDPYGQGYMPSATVTTQCAGGGVGRRWRSRCVVVNLQIHSSPSRSLALVSFNIKSVPTPTSPLIGLGISRLVKCWYSTSYIYHLQLAARRFDPAQTMISSNRNLESPLICL